MNGELQILKSELSNTKINNDNLLNKNNFSNEDLQKYSSKIKDLQSELNIVKLKQNNDDNLLNHKILKINDLETKLTEKNAIIEEYKNKFNLINKELDETKNIVLNLNKEKEFLLKENEEFKKNSNTLISKNKEKLLNENEGKIELKKKDQERELSLFKKMIENLKTENKLLKEKMNDYEEIKIELECIKNMGKNCTYIEVNKSSLKEKYDKLMEENKKLKENLIQNQ